MKAGPEGRGRYRHGDLRQALVEAGTALAREGGPEAVVLREATRRAGVVPNAAYRHFANRADLLLAVRSAALARLAQAMEAELARMPADASPADQARASLRAIGTGYMQFARAETGLFRTAFGASDVPRSPPDPSTAGPGGLNPFQLLGAALDRMARAGVLPSGRREDAEYLAWSAVHGLSMLVIDGVLRGLDPPRFDALADRLLAMVENGL